MIARFKSKINYVFLISSIISIGVCLLFMYLLLWMGYTKYVEEREPFAMIILLLIFLIIPIFQIIHYVIYSFSIIEITEKEITNKRLFSTNSYQWKDVKNIIVEKRRWTNLPSVMMIPVDCVILKLLNGTEIEFYLQNYRNRGEIQFELFSILKQEKTQPNSKYTNVQIARRKDLEQLKRTNETNLLFTNYPWNSFNGIFCMCFTILGIGLILCIPFQIEQYKIFIFFSFLCLVIPAVAAKRMTEFQLFETHLLVRNQLKITSTKIISLNSIREAVFESPNLHNVIVLRIVFNNYTEVVYHGFNLTSKTWRQLAKKLKEKGVKIRNDTYM